MTKVPNTCPACATSLEVTQLACPGCQMRLEGRFELPELLRLGREDLEFILAFVRCSGSLKDLGKLRGQSYPTVRNRLDDIIVKLSGPPEADPDAARRQVLDALARGEVSVKEASRRLKELES